MWSFSVLFWFAAFVSAVWNGWMYMGFLVGRSYHPLASLGDLLRPFKEALLLLPIPIAALVFLLWLWRRPLKDRVYQFGLVLLVAASTLPWLPTVDSGYRQEYWLAETRYDIPWQFAPFAGSSVPGGKYFLVRVSVPDLEPRYETSDPTVVVGKAVDFHRVQGGAGPLEPCTIRSSRTECQWKRGDFVYLISGSSDLLPSDTSSPMDAIADLLDGFEAHQQK
jgi:hypothetical protein